MPKIRGVKPDYWTDEDIVDLSIPARLLFIGLWNHACDNGHLQDKPKQIKMRVLPGDEVNVAELLRELATKDRIVRENGWITVPNFAKHQRPDKRYFQTCDAPGCVRADGDSQPETRGAHHETTTGTRRGPDVGSMGPHVDGEGEVMVKGSEGEEGVGLTPHEPPRIEIEQICKHLADRIEANGSKRPTITARWRNEARLMLDRDGRTVDQVNACITWLFASTNRDAQFWRTNIRAMPKLRAEYDRLRELAERAPATGRRNDIDWDLAMERAGAMGGAE